MKNIFRKRFKFFKKRLDKAKKRILKQIFVIICFVVGFSFFLNYLGVNLSAIVAGLGLTSFAIGFALKDVLANVLSGVLLLVYNPFKFGDYVKVAGRSGYLKMIDLRYTTLEKDGRRYLIPNSLLFKETFEVTDKNVKNFQNRKS